MKVTNLSLWAIHVASLTLATPVLDTASPEHPNPAPIVKRDSPTGFAAGEPEDSNGKGGPILGRFSTRLRSPCF